MQMMVSLVLWVLMGSLNAYFAHKRGRDPIAWFMIGILLGILGLGLLFLLPRLEQPPGTEEINDPQDVTSDYAKNEWFYLDVARQQQGPVQWRFLKNQWADGLINADSLVWSEGMANWSRVAELPGLKEELNN